MPRLLPFTSKKLIKILESLGFQLDHTTGSHFIFYNAKTSFNKVRLKFVVYN